jgi:hypothetical protein
MKVKDSVRQKGKLEPGRIIGKVYEMDDEDKKATEVVVQFSRDWHAFPQSELELTEDRPSAPRKPAGKSIYGKKHIEGDRETTISEELAAVRGIRQTGGTFVPGGKGRMKKQRGKLTVYRFDAAKDTDDPDVQLLKKVNKKLKTDLSRTKEKLTALEAFRKAVERAGTMTDVWKALSKLKQAKKDEVQEDSNETSG